MMNRFAAALRLFVVVLVIIGFAGATPSASAQELESDSTPAETAEGDATESPTPDAESTPALVVTEAPAPTGPDSTETAIVDSSGEAISAPVVDESATSPTTGEAPEQVADLGSPAADPVETELPATPTELAAEEGDSSATPSGSPEPEPAQPMVAAAEQPQSIVVVQNCLVAQVEESREYHECSVVQGVSLTVIQGGAEIGTFASDADGTVRFNLPASGVYRLRYANGNTDVWRPGQREESQLRSGQFSYFSFVPVVAEPWTVIARATEPRRVFAGPFGPAGGACFEIRSSEGETLLGPTCDADLDGEIVMGQLPPKLGYKAVMISPPPGYAPQSSGVSFGDTPSEIGGDWIATIAVSSQIVIETVGPNDEPLLGMCYSATLQEPDGIQTFGFCDGNELDEALDGRIDFNLMGFPHGEYVVKSSGTLPGFEFPPAQTFTLDEPSETLVFRPARYGSDDPTKADVLVQLVDQAGEPLPYQGACLRLIGPDGSFDYDATYCSDSVEAFVRFEDLGVGTYQLVVYQLLRPGCTRPETIPNVVINEDDLGTTVTAPDVVFTCAAPPPPPAERCTVQREATRHVDVYFGRLTDPLSGDVTATSLQLSRTITPWIKQLILKLDDESIIADGVNDWVDLPAGISVDYVWAVVEDRQLDAGGALRSDLEGSGGDVRFGETLLRGHSRDEVTSIPIATGPAGQVEGCEDYDPESNATIEMTYFVEVSVYELNATLQADEPCEPQTRTVIRELSLYYGTVAVSGGGGSQDGLALSDHISNGLRVFLENDDLDSRANGALDDWVAVGITNIEWVIGAPEGLDAEAGLLSDFEQFRLAHGGALTLDDPVDRAAAEYLLQSFVTLEEIAGCGVVAVTNNFVARVTFVELNATVAPEDEDDGFGGEAEQDDGEVTALPNTGAGRKAPPSPPELIVMICILPMLIVGALVRRKSCANPPVLPVTLADVPAAGSSRSTWFELLSCRRRDERWSAVDRR